MANQVTPFLLEKWRQAFYFFDHNKDGEITAEDFAEMADYISKKTGATEEGAAKTRQEWVKWYRILLTDPSKKLDLLKGNRRLFVDN